MGFAERFEELEIWQEARRRHMRVYTLLRRCDDFSFRDQMRRAALSVMNNAAEGFERRTRKDFAHFLDLAKASAGEVRSLTYAAQDVGILGEGDAASLRSEYELLSKRIASFQRHLR